jgi:hypothetical protein
MPPNCKEENDFHTTVEKCKVNCTEVGCFPDKRYFISAEIKTKERSAGSFEDKSMYSYTENSPELLV